MIKEYLKYLVCPDCRGDLELTVSDKTKSEVIKTGSLNCVSCKVSYPIINFIPRFVTADNYASSFGFQWKIHSKTQYDSYTGRSISKDRFFNETKWEKDLKNQLILEIGGGSGRFTEQAISTGAFVISVDYSNAVEANYESNGTKCFILQADIYKLPLKSGIFDKVYCFGVLQHTPDVEKAFLSLPKYLKNGGSVVADVYKKDWRTIFVTKYYARLILKWLPPAFLYKFVQVYISILWPFAVIIHKIPGIGRKLNWEILVPDYFDLGMDNEVTKQWAILDAFDMLSPRYDQPQTLNTMREWFSQAGLKDIEVQYGYNGIEGRGRKS